MKVDVIDLESKVVGNVDLSDSIFLSDVRSDVMHRVINWQLAKRRSGNHKAKTRAEVSHTTSKPFKQKGTGRARQGMKGVSQMRGGGVVFGPVVRSHAHKLPKKIRQMGLRSALSAKKASDNLFIVDNLNLSSPKTKDLKIKLSSLGDSSALFVFGPSDVNNFKLASAQIRNVNILSVDGLNVYDILKYEKLFISQDSLERITEYLA